MRILKKRTNSRRQTIAKEIGRGRIGWISRNSKASDGPEFTMLLNNSNSDFSHYLRFTEDEARELIERLSAEIFALEELRANESS